MGIEKSEGAHTNFLVCETEILTKKKRQKKLNFNGTAYWNLKVLLKSPMNSIFVGETHVA